MPGCESLLTATFIALAAYLAAWCMKTAVALTPMTTEPMRLPNWQGPCRRVVPTAFMLVCAAPARHAQQAQTVSTKTRRQAGVHRRVACALRAAPAKPQAPWPSAKV
jgi:hypothetical protein